MAAASAGRSKTLLGELRASVGGYWAGRESYQTFVYAVAALLGLSGVLHGVVFLVEGGSWEGPVSWRKPILCGFSLGLTALALAWITTFLPRRRRAGWALLGSFGAASVAEVALIDLQRWRGVPSHFNLSTPFDSAVFSGMGLLVSVVATDIVIITIWSLFALRAPPSLSLAIRVGLILLVIGQILGGLIITTGMGQLAEQTPSAFGPNGVIFGAAGVMKVPHGIALHALQVLPFLAWVLGFADWSEAQRMGVVAAASLGYAGLVSVAVYQTYSGLAPFAERPLIGVVLVVSFLLLVGAYALAGIAVARRQAG